MPHNETPKLLENLAYQAARWTGSSWAFLIAAGITLSWLISGPFFAFANSWQLTMDTFCSTTTFIMVFLLHRSQNKDSLAMQIKLNEIIAALQGANNHLINIEDLSEEEILTFRKGYQNLATKIQSSDQASTNAVSTDDVLNLNTKNIPHKH